MFPTNGQMRIGSRADWHRLVPGTCAGDLPYAYGTHAGPMRPCATEALVSGVHPVATNAYAPVVGDPDRFAPPDEGVHGLALERYEKRRVSTDSSSVLPS
jgi:hypothetical protein